MGLSRPDRPIKDQVLLVLDERAAGQIGPGQRRRQPEILIFVALERLIDREARLPQIPGLADLFAVGRLALQDAQEELLLGGRAFLGAETKGRLAEGQAPQQPRDLLPPLGPIDPGAFS